MNSKKKHNIQFTKPAEPPFLTRLKQQAGYVEGPNVDTKKEKLPEIDDDDFQDRDDERPVVVVMNEGDLTEQEAYVHVKIQEAQKEVAKAELSQKIIFKRKKNPEDLGSAECSNPKEVKKKKSSKPPMRHVLSFNDEEDE
ncbi:uncharacterized protein KIAA1143 homolog isoform X2 [Copidosoma floridanum]|uniref:uncharacterized protein KIAA1143 homolog isoform X2 n=1 Tax=Copidosoma floridanum TaxID=29053 RepID=UPI000C6F9D33|nr:uncharacterized protein KIAA1143 homolog isoform X2 [Copidosoma floridanum]